MQGAITLRSARCQSAYWDNGDLRLVNHLTRGEYAANPIVLQIIGFFYSPRTIGDALRKFDTHSPRSVGEAILKLIDAELLLECGSPEAARDELLDSQWKPWLPHGAYHFLTKDAPYAAADRTLEQDIQAISGAHPAQLDKADSANSIADARHPAQTEETDNALADAAKTAQIEKAKCANSIAGAPQSEQLERTVGGKSMPLPLHDETDSFFKTLHARRTRRIFSRRPVPLASVSTLLHTTWGVQGYVESPGFGPMPLKTSPSGGARHPVEVYLMALRVEGLDPGLYHYDGREHALERLSAGATPEAARDYCADQPYVAEAAALFVMTGVFARTMCKYQHPRAYRVVLLDAGHLGQTFCLTATRLGLAPFSTAALKDTVIERDLGIDGISESVLYVTGIGMPAQQ